VEWILKKCRTTPHLIFTEEIDPSVGFKVFKQEELLLTRFSGNAFKEMVKFIDSLYNAYIGSDASMFEINPVLKNLI
jgi:succinyl-CoA synthetase beta subunit